nr:MAG TPA: hypothetical protein [Caudoviricetes sp.]
MLFLSAYCKIKSKGSGSNEIKNIRSFICVI